MLSMRDGKTIFQLKSYDKWGMLHREKIPKKYKRLRLIFRWEKIRTPF